MGLDVMVKEYLEIPDSIKTEDELTKYCREHDGNWTIYAENHKNLPKKYVKKIPLRLCDWEATFKKRGLDFNDYEETCAAIGRWYDFRKKEEQRGAERHSYPQLPLPPQWHCRQWHNGSRLKQKPHPHHR